MQRVRDWFFTNTKTSLKRGSRFKKEDVPTEDTFKDLIDSVVFKAEPSDTPLLVPSGGLPGQLLTKLVGGESAWVSPPYSPIIWDMNLTTAGITDGVINKGYVAEGVVSTILTLPFTGSTSLPLDGDKVGVGASIGSSVIVKLFNQIPTFYTVLEGQSFIFRYDGSLNNWLIESSHVTERSSTSIYVDAFAAPGGTGSALLPYNEIELAYIDVIGSGTAIAPEKLNRSIIVTAGVFTLIDANLWINTALYHFNEGVVVNYNTPGLGYLFQNFIPSISSNTTSTVFTVTGKGVFNMQNATAGFIKANGSYTPVSSSANVKHYMNISFDTVARVRLSSETASTPVCSVIVASCAADLANNKGYNNGSPLLDIDARIISGENSSELVNLTAGANVTIKNAYITSSHTSNNKLRLAINIDSCFNVWFIDCTIGGAGASKHVLISGICDTIKFIRCTGYVYSGISPDLSNNNIIKLNNTISNKFVSANLSPNIRAYGLFIEQCGVTSNNFTPSSIYYTQNPLYDSSLIYGYFLFCRENTDSDYETFTADIANVDMSAKISTYIGGYYIGVVLQNIFRQNIISFNNALDKTVVYKNMPTTSVGLDSGMVWSNGGVLTIIP